MLIMIELMDKAYHAILNSIQSLPQIKSQTLRSLGEVGVDTLWTTENMYLVGSPNGHSSSSPIVSQWPCGVVLWSEMVGWHVIDMMRVFQSIDNSH